APQLRSSDVEGLTQQLLCGGAVLKARAEGRGEIDQDRGPLEIGRGEPGRLEREGLAEDLRRLGVVTLQVESGTQRAQGHGQAQRVRGLRLALDGDGASRERYRLVETSEPPEQLTEIAQALGHLRAIGPELRRANLQGRAQE